MSSAREKGLQIFGELLGETAAAELNRDMQSDSFAGVFGGLGAEFAFGSIWGREGLERAQRSLVMLGALVALRQPAELKIHIRIAMTNGLAKREIEEAILQTLPYVGFPAARTATAAMREVFRDLGIDTDGPTIEERGGLG